MGIPCVGSSSPASKANGVSTSMSTVRCVGRTYSSNPRTRMAGMTMMKLMERVLGWVVVVRDRVLEE